MFDKDTQKLIDGITVKDYLADINIKADPTYYLAHNKRCAEFRRKAMNDVDDFGRGLLFGTACICNGAEECSLDRIKVTIERYYQKDGCSVHTEQSGSLFGAEAYKALESLVNIVQKGGKVTGDFGEETVTEAIFSPTI